MEGGKKEKIISAAEAAALIKDGDTVATGGFVGIGFAEELAIAIENRFKVESAPRDLTLVYAAGQGDGNNRGLNHFGHEGLLKRVIGGHWGLVPNIQKLALENKIEGYNLPQGVIAHLFRDIGAGKKGTLTHVGLKTFVDPRVEGGKINPKTTEDLVKLIEIEGEEQLFYKAFPIDIAILRGTTADPDGNISMEKEALTLESIALAIATKNSGGKVIVQVERIAAENSINPRNVVIPGIHVDYVVVAEAENHTQTFSTKYNPAFSGEIKVPVSDIKPMPFGIRKVIARRAAMELSKGDVVNLGIGLPEGVSAVANEEEIIRHMVLTAEPGVVGGVPAGGLDFGATANPQAIVDQPYQFDFYDGGGLDIAFLGLAQTDARGNVNVSRFGGRIAGAGGFINISQNTRKVVFLGSFTAGKKDVEISCGNVSVVNHNSKSKFINQVEQITFSGDYAREKDQKILYITERCVFGIHSNGIELIEIAPGIDLEKDILQLMEFKPQISPNLKLMPEKIFCEERLGKEFFRC